MREEAPIASTSERKRARKSRSRSQETAVSNAGLGGEFATKLHSCKVLQCQLCLRKSDARNPFKDQAEWADHSDLPWASGSRGKKKGPGCKPCIGVWTLGGYAEKYDSIENWQKQKQQHNLGGRWEDSRKVFINGCNSGEFGARIRGGKTDGCSMSSLQKRLVSRQHEFTRLLHTRKKAEKTKGRYWIMTLPRYEQTHDGRTAASDGLVPKQRFVKGKWRETVLVSRDAEGQWAYETEDEEAIELEDVVDDGLIVVDDDQLDRKFEHHSSVLDKNVEGAGVYLDVRPGAGAESAESGRLGQKGMAPPASESEQSDGDGGSEDSSNGDLPLGPATLRGRRVDALTLAPLT